MLSASERRGRPGPGWAWSTGAGPRSRSPVGSGGQGGASPLGTEADGRKDGLGGAGQDSAGGVLASTGDSIPQVTCSETQQELPEPAGDRPHVSASYL